MRGKAGQQLTVESGRFSEKKNLGKNIHAEGAESTEKRRSDSVGAQS
jgi:hypothetical protein